MSYELNRSLEVVEEGMYVCGAIALVGVYSIRRVLWHPGQPRDWDYFSNGLDQMC